MIPPISGSTPLNNLQLDKLKKGAREFEAMMIQQLWKGAKEEDSGENQTLTDMGTQAMSAGMAAHGGMGIARMIEKSLK